MHAGLLHIDDHEHDHVYEHQDGHRRVAIDQPRPCLPLPGGHGRALRRDGRPVFLPVSRQRRLRGPPVQLPAGLRRPIAAARKQRHVPQPRRRSAVRRRDGAADHPSVVHAGYQLSCGLVPSWGPVLAGGDVARELLDIPGAGASGASAPVHPCRADRLGAVAPPPHSLRGRGHRLDVPDERGGLVPRHALDRRCGRLGAQCHRLGWRPLAGRCARPSLGAAVDLRCCGMRHEGPGECMLMPSELQSPRNVLR
mmetsp:Transcript_42293/g.122290  ORF Transcript_42293/g.122290 Transcript_42293/m.122290 type:complete len:253 (-) Transcript_42293:402-1160(-)